MENLLEVVQERNRALNLLESGESGEPGRTWTYNKLGIGYWRKHKEHYYPRPSKYAYYGQRPWQYKYLRLFAEKKNKRAKYRAWKKREWEEKMRERFPDAEID